MRGMWMIYERVLQGTTIVQPTQESEPSKSTYGDRLVKQYLRQPTTVFTISDNVSIQRADFPQPFYSANVGFPFV